MMPILRILKKIAIKIISPIFYPIIEMALKDYNLNIRNYQNRKSLIDSVEYIEQYMQNAKSFSTSLDLLTFALSKVDSKKNGLICEFGVATGRTINHIASIMPDTTVYGFDSFEGLPEDWREEFPKGKFKMDQLPKVSSNVRLIKGLFANTLAPFLKTNLDKALFLHIDCDLYSSTTTILKEFESCIQIGTVIVFDEYFNFPEWRDEEHKAFIEFIEKKDLNFEYIGYSQYQVAVIIT